MGQVFELHFKSDNFNDIVSVQMGMNWDMSQLSFVEFNAKEMAGTVAAIPDDNNNTIRMSWFDAQGVGASFNEADTLFTISFIALTEIDDLANILEIDTVSFQTEAHNSNLEPMDIVLVFEENPTSITSIEKVGYRLHQNMPNPFAETTHITFELPTAMDAQVIIYNTVGEVVKKYSDFYQKGRNRIKLDKEKMGNGVYFYTLRTIDFAQTRKMTVVQ
jgi:hypothetical protein